MHRCAAPRAALACTVQALCRGVYLARARAHSLSALQPTGNYAERPSSIACAAARRHRMGASQEKAWGGTVAAMRPTPSALLAADVDASHQALTIIDTSSDNGTGAIVYCNAAFESLTGYGQADLLGRGWTLLCGPNTHAGHIARVATALACGQELEIEMACYRKGGAPFWNRLRLAPLPADLPSVHPLLPPGALPPAAGAGRKLVAIQCDAPVLQPLWQELTGKREVRCVFGRTCPRLPALLACSCCTARRPAVIVVLPSQCSSGGITLSLRRCYGNCSQPARHPIV